MPIEFRCNNVAGFDAARQDYVRCNQLLRVSSDRVGQFVNCPKCAQRIEVPAGNKSDVEKTKLKSAAPPVTSREFDRPDVMEMDFDAASSKIAKDFADSKSRCAKCGGRYSPNGICTVCKYAEPIQKTERQFSSKPEAVLSGFQLWLSTISTDPHFPKYFGYVLFVLSFLMFGLMIGGGILSTTPIGVALAVVAGFCLVVLFSIFITTRQLARDPEAGLGLLKPFWNLLLFASRHYNWQKYDARLRGRKIIDRRKSPVSDAQLLGIDGLDRCEVLDLEDSEITDSTLRQLYGHHRLRCLVVRNTQTTKGGIARLQQAIPRLWIWY